MKPSTREARHQMIADDTRLSAAEKALYSTIYDAVDDTENMVGQDITLLILNNMVRRAVTRGRDLDDVLDAARKHGEHQRGVNGTGARVRH